MIHHHLQPAVNRIGVLRRFAYAVELRQPCGVEAFEVADRRLCNHQAGVGDVEVIARMDEARERVHQDAMARRWLQIDRAKERVALDKAIREFDIRASRNDMLVGQLSGGNQQKLLLAKMMMTDPSIIIIDEPTRGIDIGTKEQIYKFIAVLAAQGRSIIVVSSEMQELIGICDRIMVMRSGRIVGAVTGEHMNENEIVVLATGVKSAEAA